MPVRIYRDGAWRTVEDVEVEIGDRSLRLTGHGLHRLRSLIVGQPFGVPMPGVPPHHPLNIYVFSLSTGEVTFSQCSVASDAGTYLQVSYAQTHAGEVAPVPVNRRGPIFS